MDAIEAYWQDFLTQGGLPGSTRYLEAFHFELTQAAANELAALVLSGQKRATASALAAYRGETPLPQAGDYSIVTDWTGNPLCVIQTQEVTILPFNKITFELCCLEGEDHCLESWQAKHRRFFTADGEELGYAFTENMPVVFEAFKVVYKAHE